MDPSLPRQPFGSLVHLSPSHPSPPWLMSLASPHLRLHVCCLPLPSFLVTALPIKLMSSAPRLDSRTIHVPYPPLSATLLWA